MVHLPREPREHDQRCGGKVMDKHLPEVRALGVAELVHRQVQVDAQLEGVEEVYLHGELLGRIEAPVHTGQSEGETWLLAVS